MQLQGCRKKEETAKGNYTSQKEPTATFNDMSKKDRGNHVIMNGNIPEKEV